MYEIFSTILNKDNLIATISAFVCLEDQFLTRIAPILTVRIVVTFVLGLIRIRQIIVVVVKVRHHEFDIGALVLNVGGLGSVGWGLPVVLHVDLKSAFEGCFRIDLHKVSESFLIVAEDCLLHLSFW